MAEHWMVELLRKDVVPALGCTEPVCVALCAAYAGREITEEIVSIQVSVNAGIYKNGMSAGIPHCSEVGLDHAAALGACLKNPDKQLELLSDMTEEIWQQASRYIAEERVTVNMDPQQTGLYVRCQICGMTETVTSLIRDAHTNMVHLEKNGEILWKTNNEQKSVGDNDHVERLQQMTIAQIRQQVDDIDADSLLFLLDGVTMNETLATYSEDKKVGVGIAGGLRQRLGSELFANDLLNRILVKVASAAESRLDGCPLPTMSSSGAGTKGLVVILPISETARAVEASREKTVRALAIGHLINRYINAHIGKLSPMCSCVMASSTAAAAGMVYLLGGTDEQISHAIRNMSGTVTGMICDGGKVGCALKVSTGSAAAVLCALTAMDGGALRASDGICAETPEQCIRNMARIGKQGMDHTDGVILDIMTDKKIR